MALVASHALLHEATRSRTPNDQVVATLDDYAAVYALVGDVVSEGVALSVSPKVRTTVEVVRKCLSFGSRTGLSISELATALGVHESNARRRAYECFAAGYLANQSPKGRPLRIVLGEALPDDVQALPSPELLARACARARTEPQGTP